MSPILLPPRNRYLVPFDLKRVPHMFTDVLIVGGGIAGIRAALAVDPRLKTVVVTKDRLVLSNSSWAQGGIAGVLDPLDDIANHLSDTLAAGKGLCDEEVVRGVVKEAPQRIRELAEYGTRFDSENGAIALTQEGGHSHRRVAHAFGDATGKEIMRALIEKVRGAEHIDIWENTFTIDLLTHEDSCRGALVWSSSHGKTFVWAKQTILCTGGAGQLYRETTNPSIATGDGHAAAFRAGAELRDMEFMQFHPTVLYIAGSSRHLITEAVRGEGGYLRDVAGTRFMPEYHPQAELAPRDEVSLAIAHQMQKTKHPCVYLDLSHLDSDLVRERFPSIGKVCAEFGLDITSDPIPVRPGAHYMIGGATIDLSGRTTLAGLWAAGEVTSSGLHGANRLGSNSLIEGLVFGLRTGRGASERASEIPDRFEAIELHSPPHPPTPEEDDLDIGDLRNSLSSLMWRQAGIQRNEAGLLSAQQQVEFWDRYVSRRTFTAIQGWELQNLLLLARIVIASALARKESRGVHTHRDYPETREELCKHISVIAGE
ncbi:MAG TPA: L-aspartate oxidase [Planctomycetaceae bacterium]|nr:L-aspartate oxidase [Planctomycetaceae bacterium]